MFPIKYLCSQVNFYQRFFDFKFYFKEAAVGWSCSWATIASYRSRTESAPAWGRPHIRRWTNDLKWNGSSTWLDRKFDNQSRNSPNRTRTRAGIWIIFRRTLWKAVIYLFRVANVRQNRVTFHLSSVNKNRVRPELNAFRVGLWFTLPVRRF